VTLTNSPPGTNKDRRPRTGVENAWARVTGAPGFPEISSVEKWRKNTRSVSFLRGKQFAALDEPLAECRRRLARYAASREQNPERLKSYERELASGRSTGGYLQFRIELRRDFDSAARSVQALSNAFTKLGAVQGRHAAAVSELHAEINASLRAIETGRPQLMRAVTFIGQLHESSVREELARLPMSR
jgi:hypothetical protein